MEGMDSPEHDATWTAIKGTPALTTEMPRPESWRTAYNEHYKNFVCLVSRDWAAMSFLNRLVFSQVSPGPEEDLGYRVNFAEMQRMYLRASQLDLIHLAIELKFDKTLSEEEEWSDTPESIKKMNTALKTYIQAVRDYEYMTDATQKPYDLFIASSERYQDQVHLRHAMIDALKSLHSFGAKERQNPIPSGPWEQEPSGDGGAVPIGGTRNASVKNLLQRALVMRICMALIASTLLIGPMWLLALKRDLIFDLGTTTVAVTVFGLLLAFVLDKRDQVFTGTLAYAAVLMVFVGVIIQETSI